MMKPLLPGGTAIDLTARTGASRKAEGWLATATPCWLDVPEAAWAPGGRWVRIVYSTSFFDDPVRPLIRFELADGTAVTEPMNGPVFGRGAWIGRIPDKTQRIAISPVADLGRFGFRIDGIAPVSRVGMIRRGLGFDPAWLPWAFGAKLIGSHREAWQTLRFAATATPLSGYAAWRKAMLRAWEPEGLDRPRFDWAEGPTFHLVMPAGGATPQAVAATIASLQAQVYPRWRLTITGSHEGPLSPALSGLTGDDGRITVDGDLQEMAANDLVSRVRPGTRLAPYALAVVADVAHRAPEAIVLYGDEDTLPPSGQVAAPRFKPVWSPRFQARTGYLSDGVFLKIAGVDGAMAESAEAFAMNHDGILAAVCAQGTPATIRHIRRVLCSCPPRPATASAASPRTEAATMPLPKVAIVIPTRDHPRLLAKCVEGLETLTDYPDFEVVLVDNGTIDKQALALIEQLKTNPRYTVLHRPGPFNYSALCNDGAAASDAPMLLFLNNDIVMLNDQWLKPLVALAQEPDVGIVGSKLLFPNGRIQHAGVVLGLGSIAGHIYRGEAADIPGYLGRLTVPHEVSSVTGACVAIERRKFDAIGRYDAKNLPVELNDIDLCLRAAEHGLTTLWTPESVLCHLQSASRGFQVKPYKVYDKERRFFIERWAHVIRDDRYFHPALSLFSHRPALA